MTGTIIEGTVHKVVFQARPDSDEPDFAIISLRSKDNQEVVALGDMPGVVKDAKVAVRGGWTQHHKYGTQFRVESFKYLGMASEEEKEKNKELPF